MILRDRIGNRGECKDCGTFTFKQTPGRHLYVPERCSIHKIQEMRQIALIPHPEVRISILHWNGRYLLKFERPYTEQIFKLPEHVADETAIKQFASEVFVADVLKRFEEMEKALSGRVAELAQNDG